MTPQYKTLGELVDAARRGAGVTLVVDNDCVFGVTSGGDVVYRGDGPRMELHAAMAILGVESEDC